MPEEVGLSGGQEQRTEDGVRRSLRPNWEATCRAIGPLVPVLASQRFTFNSSTSEKPNCISIPAYVCVLQNGTLMGAAEMENSFDTLYRIYDPLDCFWYPVV